VLDQRGQLLRAAVGFAGCSMPSYDRALHALQTWLDSWPGIGRVAVGMRREGFEPATDAVPTSTAGARHSTGEVLRPDARRRVERALDLHDVVLVQAMDLDDRARRVRAGAPIGIHTVIGDMTSQFGR
jgi:hypothetical protein